MRKEEEGEIFMQKRIMSILKGDLGLARGRYFEENEEQRARTKRKERPRQKEMARGRENDLQGAKGKGEVGEDPLVKTL